MSIFAASIFAFSYINTPTAEMREKPDSESEIVSEALYSEQVDTLESSNGWTHIKTVVDNYEGWVRSDSLLQRDKPYPTTAADSTAKVKIKCANLYKVPDTIFGPILKLPFESRLEIIDNSNPRWIKVRLPDNKEAYIQKGDVEIGSKKLTLEEMCLFSKNFLNLPYTWGGRSSFGYDCSGYVQMLFRQMGVFIPRDTKDQIKWNGFKEVALKDIQRGDLVYWGLEEGKIRHVGLYLGNDAFIHSTVLEDGQISQFGISVENNAFIHATVAQNEPNIHVSKLTDSEWNGSARFKYVAIRRLAK